MTATSKGSGRAASKMRYSSRRFEDVSAVGMINEYDTLRNRMQQLGLRTFAPRLFIHPFRFDEKRKRFLGSIRWYLGNVRIWKSEPSRDRRQMTPMLCSTDHHAVSLLSSSDRARSTLHDNEILLSPLSVEERVFRFSSYSRLSKPSQS